MKYEIDVCPLCGTQVEYEGGYDGMETIFNCEHSSWMDEYGSVQPIKVPVVPRGLKALLAAVVPALEKQRDEKARKDAEHAAKRKARWDAMTPEQQQREMERNERFGKILKDAWKDAMISRISNRGPLWQAGRTAVVPFFTGDDISSQKDHS